MTGSDGPADQAPSTPRRPRIVVEFDRVNGSECTLRPDPDVTTGQLYLAAWLLDAYAHETRIGERAMLASRRPGLVVPGAGGVPAAGRD